MILSRRRLLRLLGASAAGAVIVGCEGVAPVVRPRWVDRGDPSRGPGASGTTSTSARDFGFDTDIALTPNADFYVMKRGRVPEIVVDDHVLTIDGLVQRPVSLTLDDIKALPQHTLIRTLECIGNAPDGDLIGNAVWSGARFADVLALAGLRASASELRLDAADDFHTGVTTALATDPDSYLVHTMNGETLPLDHGYPFRCLFPGRYGQKQPKWLIGITARDTHHVGYYESKGWSDEAAIQVKSRIDSPPRRATVRAPLTIRGIAFAGRSGVARVEVLVDDLAPVEATLVQAPVPHRDLAWTEWSWTWHAATPGNHVVRARAVDGDGTAQSPRRRSLLGGEVKEGRSDMHSVSIFVEG